MSIDVRKACCFLIDFVADGLKFALRATDGDYRRKMRVKRRRLQNEQENQRRRRTCEKNKISTNEGPSWSVFDAARPPRSNDYSSDECRIAFQVSRDRETAFEALRSRWEVSKSSPGSTALSRVHGERRATGELPRVVVAFPTKSIPTEACRYDSERRVFRPSEEGIRSSHG